MSPKVVPGAFARRVREMLADARMSMADLATQSGLDQSYVSKLLAESDATRREPKLDHVFSIARALKVGPSELAFGTEAEALLGGWVEREQLEREAAARSKAETDAAKLRTDLAAATRLVETLKGEVEDLVAKVANAEDGARQWKRRCAEAEETAAVAMSERDVALASSETNYMAWRNAVSQNQRLQAAVKEAKGAAWFAGLAGAIGGALVASSAEPPRRASAQRSRPTKRKKASR